ncbi:AAA family ATPase [Variovorax humicola]|uniref:AAA family ATPase n=1 Tax=Variovorax humicola TaxID=1769758 RepID=A0ABU8WB56_9BURK
MAQSVTMNRHATTTDPVDPTLPLALRRQLQASTGEPVALVETHISWVLLTSSLAYKLKKPVRLAFVDFSTLAARRHFCAEELRLNQLHAPGLYLDVLPVCGTPQAPRLGAADDESAEPIDYVVRMRRFPDGMLLRELLLSGRLDAVELDGLAERLASLHAAAPVAEAASGFGAPERVEGAVMAALDGLEAACGAARILSLRRWVEARVQGLRMAWLLRQRTGAVRECHGDLHLANVVRLDGRLLPFDCIEFDPALRWIDVMSDLAFLTMDLKAHGRTDLAFRFLDRYLQHSGDFEGLPVLRFYEVYRALVRAQVACLRAPSGAGQPDAEDYLRCAEDIVRRAERAPRLLITHGLSGSGKSTMAGQLLELAGAVRLRSDVERKRLFGLPALARSADRGIDIYTPEATRRSLARIAEGVRLALHAGYPTIVDAAFLRRAERASFRALAASLRLPFAILDLRASPAQLRHRVAARLAEGGDPSEADAAVLERQFAFHEALDAQERAIAITTETEPRPEAATLCALWMAGA